MLGASGAVVGLIVALMYRLTAAPSTEPTSVTYSGTYVPMEGLTMSQSYGSTLSITTDPPVAGWGEVIAVCAVVGLALGLLVAGALALTRRRIALVSASSPTG